MRKTRVKNWLEGKRDNRTGDCRVARTGIAVTQRVEDVDVNTVHAVHADGLTYHRGHLRRVCCSTRRRSRRRRRLVLAQLTVNDDSTLSWWSGALFCFYRRYRPALRRHAVTYVIA